MSRWALARFKIFQHHLPVTGDSIRLVSLFIISILLAFWLARGSATAKMLFQSPTSPVEQAPAQPPQNEQPPAQQPQPQQPQPEPTPTDPPPTQQPSTEQAQPQQPQNEEAPAQQPITQTETSVSPAGEDGEEFLAEPEAPAPEPIDIERFGGEEIAFDDEGAADSQNFILDQIELIDTVVVSSAYIWLCCGVLLFLLAPVFMLVLYIRGRSLISREEGF